MANARYRRDLTLFWISMHLSILKSDFKNFVINKDSVWKSIRCPRASGSPFCLKVTCTLMVVFSYYYNYYYFFFLIPLPNVLSVLFHGQEAQLNEVLSASNLDPTALTVVTRKLEVISLLLLAN